MSVIHGVLGIALLVLSGTIAYHDESAAEREYCAMVAEGNWPDFRKGEVICENQKN